MKIVVQRVLRASVSVENQLISSIKKGYFVLLGVEQHDTKQNAEFLAQKLSKLRVMADAEGKMNMTASSVGGEMLVVSQFTLLADTQGNRPSFISAARPEIAKPLYDCFIDQLISLGISVKAGSKIMSITLKKTYSNICISKGIEYMDRTTIQRLEQFNHP